MTAPASAAPSPDRAAPARVVRFEANPHGRDFAVGDIHGAFSALLDALRHIGFDPTCDRLFSVGDLVDRGPESHMVLRLLDQPWFHALCGNHDFMTWRSALGDPYEDVDHEAHGGEWLQQLTAEKRQRVGLRLKALPMAIEVVTAQGIVGLVHADYPADDWQYLHQIDWDAQDRMDSAAGRCLWSIDRFRQRYTDAVRNVRAVVHGHMTIPAMVQLGNVYFIDTGGWRRGGRFTLLELGALTAYTGAVV